MNKDIERKEKPFDSFTLGYKILVLAGFYRLLNKPENKLKHIFHQIYRLLACLVVVIYNLQHIIFITQIKNNNDARLECVMTEIPQMNVLFKFLAICWQTSSIDKIHDLLNDQIFAPGGKKDEEYLKTNRIEMSRLIKVINTCVTLAGIFWPMSHIVRRIHDEDTVIPFYVPFETDTWTKFAFASIMPVIPLLWVGYAHLSLDALIATYYAQGYIQLKIIKHNLECIFNSDDVTEYCGNCYNFNLQYRDDADKTMDQRFVHYVKRYEKVVWSRWDEAMNCVYPHLFLSSLYTKEVSRVFNPIMSFQFFTSSAAICIVIYKMSMTDILSVPFIFLFLLIIVLLFQVFIYCYYGNLVTYESQSVITSLYLSDWQCLSPRFCRQLLIAMSRWSQPLTTHVAGVIPLSLDTFVSIVKASYSLFTMLTINMI